MRSKALLASNLLATGYCGVLLWVFGGAVMEAGGTAWIQAVGAYFELAFRLLGMDSPALNLLYAAAILLCAHIAAFVLGCLTGWIAYARRKSGGAAFAATLYLLGALCFPVYLLFGLPIAIVGFVGGSLQKKINRAAPAA
ncbi:MAG: hypothetical protein ACOYJA_06875 [Christensenellales bacterium]